MEPLFWMEILMKQLKMAPWMETDHPGLQKTKGHIGFLGHGDRLKFRNISIQRNINHERTSNKTEEHFLSKVA